MRKIKMFALIGASALAFSAASTLSAQAQPWGYHDQGYGYQNRGYDSRLNTSYVDSLDWKITNAAQRGVISWPQARELRAQLRVVQPIAYRYQTGQARPWEIRRLQMTVDHIEGMTNSYAYNDRRYRGDYWRR